MHPSLRLVLLTILVIGPIYTVSGKEATAAEKARSKAEVEEAARLQVFLDRAEFAPGKIDGQYGEFTLKALALYRQAHADAPSQTSDKIDAKPEPKKKSKAKTKSPPDVSGLNLASINPVFITYLVADADLQAIGVVPESIPAQAKQKSLPYRDAVEALAEKFHCDQRFLRELNPGKGDTIKAGDELMVPNVEPFELSAVKEMKPGSDLPSEAANDRSDESGSNKKKKTKPNPHDKTAESAQMSTTVKIDIKTNMLTIFEDGKIVAAFPVTVGSKRTGSPVGDWKVRGFDKLPTFRYDKAMLNKGERSGDFHMLPPGPNNPVGVMWIALNKKGIGIHGTSDPDSIGRSASHGCVRLANWDVVRVARKIKAGVPVTIH